MHELYEMAIKNKVKSIYYQEYVRKKIMESEYNNNAERLKESKLTPVERLKKFKEEGDKNNK